jgi:hypothetical protein
MKRPSYSIFFISLFLIFLCGNALAFQVKTEVDRDKVGLGDRVVLKVTAEKDKRTEMSFPERPENTGEFSFIRSYPYKGKKVSDRRTGQVYVLGVYTTGPHVIPPVKVNYRPAGSLEWETVMSRQVPITVASRLTGQDKDIKDIKGPEKLKSRIWRTVAAVFGVLFIAGVAALFIVLRKRARERALELERNRPADVIAYSELAKLKAMNLPEQGRVKEYYIILSDIIRRYLEKRFSYRAPEMTTEEFMNYVKQKEELSGENKNILKDFLTHSDMVKFAKYGPTLLEMIDSFRLAEKFVDKTRQADEIVHEGGANDPVR